LEHFQNSLINYKMEPKLNAHLKELISNPELGNQITSAVIKSGSNLSSIVIPFPDLEVEVALIPVGYIPKFLEKNNFDKGQ
jgi:hypothetical protein